MKLYYRRYGEGAPLIILHGLYGSSDNWVTIARNLGRHFTVYLPDQRNHGHSPHSDVHDYEVMSDDLLEFVHDNKLGKFFLAGHSMGGKTAALFALKWPELLDGLIIADISPFKTKTDNNKSFNQHLAILKVLEDTDISQAVSRSEIEKLLANRIDSERIRALILKNIQRNTDGYFSWKINNAALLKNIDKILDSITGQESAYEPVTGFPVIFLKGENSDYLPPDDKSKILKLFPAAEFRIITNAGHWLHTDNPEAVTAALISLINQ
ncbi:MAG: alpha/beta fold hydrolase [Bacteroidales bacterium]|jgi:pimeloyl-ACP methyl ester carboxylesterase|nr:alpha/beta fold hydrolase [Bacteroidales bacterium]